MGGTIPGMKAPTNEEFYSDEIPEGAMGENILGRRKVDEVQNDLIDQSESTSRSLFSPRILHWTWWIIVFSRCNVVFISVKHEHKQT